MDDDEVVCRICRCEGETERPLYHPCKCSGTIKYVHNDCLLSWLRMSGKEKCEVSSQHPCKRPQPFYHGVGVIQAVNIAARTDMLANAAANDSTHATAVPASVLLHKALC